MDLIHFCHKPLKSAALAVIWAVCFFNVSQAEPPSPAAFIQAAKLDLSLSDQWLATDQNVLTHQPLHKENQTANANLNTDPGESTPVNVGCGMDVHDLPVDSTSLTSRLVGECKFRYNY